MNTAISIPLRKSRSLPALSDCKCKQGILPVELLFYRPNQLVIALAWMFTLFIHISEHVKRVADLEEKDADHKPVIFSMQ